METNSLKALANKVLQGNNRETSSFSEWKLGVEKVSTNHALKGLNCPEVPLPATSEKIQIFFDQVEAEVGASYIPGTLEMIRGNFPERWVEMQEAENQVNHEWQKARKGCGDLDVFRRVVDKWKEMYFWAIRLAHILKNIGGDQ